jgi:hypothetical protein
MRANDALRVTSGVPVVRRRLRPRAVRRPPHAPLLVADARPTTARDLLLRACVRLAEPSAWLHGSERAALAADADGGACEPSDPRAIRWDFWGAVVAAMENATPEERPLAAACDAWRRLGAAVGIGPSLPLETLVLAVCCWHDAPETTHADLLAALDRAAGGSAS